METGYVLNGRYKIVNVLGEGGMANVYVAYDLILKRSVAVKLLRLDMRDDPTAVRRFQGEAMSLTELTDPHIVMIYDIGEEDGNQYLVMEYVKGMDLKQYIKQEYPFSLTRVLEIMQQILQAVGDAHQHGIIHRDLKPQNILIDQEGNVKITDFGIALAVSSSTLTKTNTVMGSVHYISPEQARGSIVTKQADIYSLGIILFEMLTGHVPYRGENAVSIIMKHYKEAMSSVRQEEPNVPQALENVVFHATAKDLRDRYTTVEQMAGDLRTCLSPGRANESKWLPSFENDDETKVLLPPSDSELSDKDQSLADEGFDQDQISKKTKKKWSKKKRWLFVLSFLLVLLVGTGLSYAMIPKDTSVPQLKGMTTSEATESLKDANLKLGKVTKKYNNTYYFGQVIRTRPKAKTEIKEGTLVDVEISKGPKKEKFGDYTGQKYSQVKKELKKRGVTVQSEKVFSQKIPKGEIKSQSISAKKKVVMGETAVTFQVSQGAKSFELRDLLNYTLKSAQDYADEKGLTLNVTRENSDKYDEGIVMQQEPAAGTVLNQGDTISVTISDGAKEESSAESSSSSSSSSSLADSTSKFAVSVKLPFEETNQGKSNKVQIYISDKSHQIKNIYQTLDITGDREVQIPFELEDGKKGAYKIVRDGQVIEEKDDVTQE
ncbi:serine threonine protein kinase [Ligilactobacillus acidipiscis DSM 15836]|uniref:non-specific serine/threonine protein kinase n=2 Tax=Ligilactobacillus acidipiscis TaxID=89059 RepID=A0ABR5PP39_9LACO|nr:Stk1 family PASTA domain-containing Ser/Thr kinase [Ligilactobacillus acidipiscis]KRM32210.1 serine threonine protein kinase [Ligilactobacillus acidipiscis DSM 15836]GAW64624.1 serine/threonine protein kinase [Ligilactobacillus acidipiscis]GEN19450.1 protein kinase [Ligilactobacillus acidipiscis]